MFAGLLLLLLLLLLVLLLVLLLLLLLVLVLLVLLLLLLLLLVAVAAGICARPPAPCRGWPASGPGRLRLALVSDRSVRRGSRIKRSNFACTFTRHLRPVLVALRPQSRLRPEGRTRTLSGPSPDLSPARVLAPSRSRPANTLQEVTGADTPDWAVIADSAARLVRTAQALTDDDLHDASALPGWTRAHVLTHVAQAADSRTRLLRAAQAGRIGQQYPSEQARAEAIDAGARRPAGVIRADVDRAIQECLTAIREHPSQLWDAPGIWLGGGSRPVRGVLPGLRRELEYHHVDLAGGYQPADWPDDFVATELPQVTALMDRRDDAPPVTLAGHGMLRIGTSPPVDVTGPPAAMLAWLSGRSDGSGLNPARQALPPIPPLG